jgi:drug/metabolite transporter (DMT)-like permease
MKASPDSDRSFGEAEQTDDEVAESYKHSHTMDSHESDDEVADDERSDKPLIRDSRDSVKTQVVDPHHDTRPATSTYSPYAEHDGEDDESYLRGDSSDDTDSVSDDEELEVVDDETALTKSQKVVGSIFVALLVIDWLIMSMIGGDFNSPLYERYLVMSLYTFLGPLWWIAMKYKRAKCTQVIENAYAKKGSVGGDTDVFHGVQPSETLGTDVSAAHGSGPEIRTLAAVPTKERYRSTVTKSGYHRKTSNAATEMLHGKGLKVKMAVSVLRDAISPSALKDFFSSTWKWSLFLTWINFIGGWTWYVSLAHTDFAVNNTLYQSQCAFVYLITAFLTRTTTFSWRKTICVVVCLSGVAMISFASESSDDDDENKTTVFGILMTLISTLCLSVFIVLIEHVEEHYYRSHVENLDAIWLTFSFGPATFLTLWPILIIFGVTGWQKVVVALPFGAHMHHGEFWRLVLLSMMDVGYFVFLLLGVSYANALFMSSGSLLLIPVSFFVDTVILRKMKPNIMSFLGAFLICGGFLVMQFPVFEMITGLCHGSEGDGEDVVGKGGKTKKVKGKTYFRGVGDEDLKESLSPEEDH